MKSFFLKIILLFAALWLPQQAYAQKNLLVFGDSLSAGYRIDITESWPALLQQELTHSHLEYQVVNASVSGETTYGGLQRISAALQQHRPALVILELGANDGLRGNNVADMEANLDKLLRLILHSRAKVLLVGMKLPPNYGEAYTTQFEKVYTSLAQKYHLRLLPYLLQDVSAEQFQSDNLHPLASAQPLIMRRVMQNLKPLLR